MKYKVFFHRGTELGLKTKVAKGQAWLDTDGLHIKGPDEFTIPSNDILEAELFRLHGLGRVIRLDYRGGRVFLAVVRLMIGQFALINFFGGWPSLLPYVLSQMRMPRPLRFSKGGDFGCLRCERLPRTEFEFRPSWFVHQHRSVFAMSVRRKAAPPPLDWFQY